MTSGERRGSLTTLHVARRTGQRNWWLCQCDCGEQVTIRQDALLRGDKHSCKKCRSVVKHGHGGTADSDGSRTYQTWRAMRRRCNDPKFVSYRFYGALGVRVCPEWNDSRSGFKKFLEDMGERPDGMTLDRENPTGSYCKSNCRWSTNQVQQMNKRAHFASVLDDLRELDYWEQEEAKYLAGVGEA